MSCPFQKTIKNNPCNSIECQNQDWKNIDNINKNCLINIKTYCKETKDPSCDKFNKNCSNQFVL